MPAARSICLTESFGASREFRIRAVTDACRLENLCLTANTSLSGARVARAFDALVRICAKPVCIVSDRAIGTPLVRETMPRGTEFTNRAILRWADKSEALGH